MDHTMKFIYSALFTGCFIIGITGCRQQDRATGEDRLFSENLSIEWKVVSNQVADVPRCRTLLTITNNNSRALGDRGWAIYYNQDAADVVPGSVTGRVSIERLGGDFYRLSPQEGFGILPGDTVSIQMEHRGWLIKEVQAPAGMYIVFEGDREGEPAWFGLSHVTVLPFKQPEQRNRFIHDQTPDPTPGWQYKQNETVSLIDGTEWPVILPEPLHSSFSGTSVTINNTWTIQFEKGLEQEARLLANGMESFLGGLPATREQEGSGEGIIALGWGDHGANPESYNLKVTENKGININGADEAGVFYGIQSLLALVSPEQFKDKSGTVSLPVCTIEDEPRFHYRGMHLDVARNFNDKEAVLKMIDVMAFYKLNTLHLHLSDDEGWRLQIPGLPELTDIGAFRGHTLDDHQFLHPSYGSGPDPADPGNHGSGYFSRSDYLEILKYAHDRHMQVIPEFDFPGHARAAIMAMNARYRHYMSEGNEDKAEEYLLTDPEDDSAYRSAQDFNDNVICVCRGSTYRFLEKLVDEVVEMYREAGVPLYTIHIGGDEVPEGAWEGSPICTAFREENGLEEGAAGLMDYFLEKTGQILNERNLILSGWEEIVLEKDETGKRIPKPPRKGNRLQVYIWDNFTSNNQDIGDKVANAGYPVVLCSVTNFYFELSYNKDPREPGHYWGGFVDTRSAFEFVPFNLLRSLRTTPLGRPYRPDELKKMVKLDPGARGNILGLQGELWSEPIKGPDMLEYFYLPKMLGLAERAWGRQPSWAVVTGEEEFWKGLEEDWNRFANALGRRELPRLDYLFGGFNYRLPPPGLKVVDGVLHANTRFPGLVIRYTTDGSEPTEGSELYTMPVRVDGEVKARTFNTLGRGSLVAILRPGQL